MARILVTSALPYINGVKHLGNLVGSMLPADVYARWARARGHEVLALCATDEHGTPAELAAASAGQNVADFCSEQHELQRSLGESFGLSWDWFGRSSSPQNYFLTQHFAEILEKNGFIEERVTEQVYSPDDERFLPDRYIHGTCPNCGYEQARGDQCENCGKLLDPTDLVSPRSAISGSTRLEVRATHHLYLLQSQAEEKLRVWVDKQDCWPRLVKSIAYKWLDEGLMDRAITRDLSWGIPVATDGEVRKGFENKVFYVWFDAPIEYIASAQEWAEESKQPQAWQRWWRLDGGADDVKYVQFMAKDNVPFHTVGFPITLIGSQEPWKKVDIIKGFNWLTWYGGKFSTSQRRGVFMDQALELLPPDYWRWWLIANAPESDDTSFTWERFQQQCNKDLANVLGNFTNRVTRFTSTRFGETVPEGGDPSLLESWENLVSEVSDAAQSYDSALETLSFRQAAYELRRIWVAANEFITHAAPWTLLKKDRNQAAAAVRVCFGLIHTIAHLSSPIIPFTAKKLKEIAQCDAPFEWPNGTSSQVVDWLESIPAGTAFKSPDLLFQRIEDSDVEAWTARFGGSPGDA